MDLAFRFRLEPNRVQREHLELNAHARRFIWNWALERTRTHFRRHGVGITLAEQCRAITRLKRSPEGAWLRGADSQALQQAVFDLRRAYRGFFERNCGYPRYRSRKSDPMRFRIPQRVRLRGDRLYVPTVGWVRVRASRPIPGEIRSASFRRDARGSWFVSLIASVPVERPLQEVSPERTLGVDLGLVDLVVDSTGRRVACPRFGRRDARLLRRRHREVSRKRLGSRNRAKARAKLARAYGRVANRRRDFIHKLTTELVRECDALCIEDLGLAGPARTKLGRAIRDAGLGEVRRQIQYKAILHGKHAVVVDRWFPSSKRCGICGAINSELRRSQREWLCECGARHDRDVNAARNLREWGLARLVAVGLTDTQNARRVGVSLPMEAADAEAGIRVAEGQHGSGLYFH